MVNVVGVRFRGAGKVYYFDPDVLDIKAGDNVIVETARGIEFGNVVMEGRNVSSEEIVQPLKKVIRIATEEDMRIKEENDKKEKEAFDICLKKIEKHGLEMKLIDVEYTFDKNKILFYFTADGRVDFRELVKDLASVFRTRIELRQIGVRDESKMMGGIGVCGRLLCCHSFLTEFEPVSIKMAKEQGISLNPAKISGACGRLMCCLRYEQEAYSEIVAKAPREGAIVQTPEGQGVVTGVSILKEKVKVRLDRNGEADIDVFDLDDVKILKDAEKTNEDDIEQDQALKSLED
jgi:cell fate regulator YaaT (PSP1 superfamily)